MNTDLIGVGKGNPDGYMHSAPTGTTLPTTAEETLDEAFKDMGHVADTGVAEKTNFEVTEVKDWAGSVVKVIQTSRATSYDTTMLEPLNEDLLKAVYGDENVTVTNGNISIKINDKDLGYKSWVMDEILDDGVKQRTVIPRGKISAIGDITHVSTDVIKIPITITCTKDSSGNSAYRYIKTS
jgi:hypothetical protein